MKHDDSDQPLDRRRKQEELTRSEAELRAILEASAAGIINIGQNGIIQSFNPAAERLFGFSPEEAIGEDVGILMPEPDRSRHNQYISDYLRSGKAKIIGIGREVMGRRKDGTTFPMHLAVSEVRLGKRVVFTGIVHDLTELKKMQEEVNQTHTLATLGEMAALVAHEIKNPLAGISGAIQVLRDTLEMDDSRRNVMEDILGQVKRLDLTVRQLLVLSRPWNPKKEECDLREYVEHLTAAAQEQEAFSRVRFILDSEEPAIAYVDSALLEQVLWNLLHNAVQAMPQGGEIHCSLGHESDVATITLRDTGPGVPPDLQDRLFRPFFTTKTRGTGLGLPICEKIMQAHNGSITINSRPGEGTEVTLRFPHRS